MKKLLNQKGILTFLFCIVSIYIQAQAFSEGGINYSVISTSPNNARVSQNPYFSGSANIPATVTSSGITYNVTSIGSSAFQNATDLTSVTIPSSVTSIGFQSFKYCSGLTNIIIPNSVTSIDTGAFSECTNLSSITIGNSVTYIGSGSFHRCSSLTSITIPDSVTTLLDGVFYECTSLASVIIGNSVTTLKDSVFFNCNNLTCITIGNSVTSIDYSAFKDCVNLLNITIPNSVTNIDNHAFWNCSSLTNLTIGDSVTNIGDYAFQSCISLTSVTIPNSVTSIGDSAFFNCTALTSITIGDSVININDNAFRYCTALAIVNILDPTPPIINANVFNGVTISNIPLNVPSGSVPTYQTTAVWQDFDSVNVLGVTQFTEGDITYNVIAANTVEVGNNSSSSGNVIIPATVDYLGITYNVTNISNNAFLCATSLTSITIPNSVTDIGNYAFRNCIGLTSVNVFNPTPPSVDTSTFDGVTISNIPLNVPSGSVPTYQTTAVWQDFDSVNVLGITEYVGVIDNLVITVSNGKIRSNLEGITLEVYNISGQIVVNENLVHGIYIVVSKNRIGQSQVNKIGI